MSKRIAFCADGTWDTADKHTNVYKLFKSLPVTSEQMPFYDDGVGATGNPILKVIGGAFGTGLWSKIREGYTKIAHVYESGDSIFLFGFSRGAYTARSLAGMITACGLPTKDFSDDMVDTAFTAYREKDRRKEVLEKLKDHNMETPKITMVGVWDTVGSLGIPSVFGANDPIVYGFLDTSLSPNILNAYQALAIDEKRMEFPATLWKTPDVPVPGQTVEQVWFTGVHSDIGGGQPDNLPGTTALSDITLGWMMSKASALGLQIDAETLKQYTLPMDPKYSLDKLHTSWNILLGFPRYRPIGKNSVLSNSVLIRCQHDHTYRPANLQFDNGVLSAALYAMSEVMGLPPAAAQTQTAGG